MANDREGASRSGEGRRRYFRRRQQASKEKNGGAKEAPAARKRGAEKSDQVERAERSQPSVRRRRRSRGRSGAPEPKIEPGVESILDIGDYTPPTSFFIYTHVVRPGGRDNYEFRAEHFSKVGRRLEDYEIDLSQLYPDQDGDKSAGSVAHDPEDIP